MEHAVAAGMDAAGMSADNAQADAMLPEGSEVTFEELMQDDAQDDGGQTAGADGDGDGDRDGSGPRGGDRSEKDKFEARIRAALDSQRRGFARDAGFASQVRRAAQGMSDEDIVSAVREQNARRMRASLGEQAGQARAEPGDVEAYKQGIRELIADGWTREELTAFAGDASVREALAAGATLRRAAKAFLTRTRQQEGAASRRTGVPTARNTAAGSGEESERIESMSDAEFERFSRRARQAMMQGKAIRL